MSSKSNLDLNSASNLCLKQRIGNVQTCFSHNSSKCVRLSKLSESCAGNFIENSGLRNANTWYSKQTVSIFDRKPRLSSICPCGYK